MIGIDAVGIQRLARALERVPSLGARLYSAAELRHAAPLSPRRRAEWLAGRFAAKEAIAKAAHLSVYDVPPARLAEILTDADGAPRVTAVAAGRPEEWAVSITHDGDVAVAVAIARP